MLQNLDLSDDEGDDMSKRSNMMPMIKGAPHLQMPVSPQNQDDSMARESNHSEAGENDYYVDED